MKPLLVLLERLWGPLRACLTALGASWGALGRVFGALRELLGTSSAQETLYILKMSFPPRREHDFRNLFPHLFLFFPDRAQRPSLAKIAFCNFDNTGMF